MKLLYEYKISKISQEKYEQSNDIINKQLYLKWWLEINIIWKYKEKLLQLNCVVRN